MTSLALRAALALAVLACPAAARAGVIGVVTVSGTASGTVSDPPAFTLAFADARVTIRGRYDAAAVVDTFTAGYGRQWYAPLLDATVTIAEPGLTLAVAVAVPGFVFSYDPAGALSPGFYPSGYPLVIGMTFPYNLDGFNAAGAYSHSGGYYDLSYPLPATPLNFDPPLPGGIGIGAYSFHLPTAGGDLHITGQDYADWTVQVDVAPEPATLTMLGIGAVGLAGYGRRRRSRA
jgi:hypothetical protein